MPSSDDSVRTPRLLPEPGLLPVPDMLCFALYSAAHAMQRRYAPLLEKLGLTYPQYLTLSALWAQGAEGLTVGQIGKLLHLESNTLTPLLKRMEVQGLLSRQRSAKDERQVAVRLTAKGRALAEQAAPVPGCFLQSTGMSVQEATALRDEVTALRDRLCPE